MTFKHALLGCALLMATASLQAEVYRHVDAQGNVTFSDEPMDGSEPVTVKPVTTITLPKPQDVQDPPALAEKAEREGADYDRVSILSPNDGEAFHSGSGNVQFQVSSTPSLKPGHKYEVTLDGQPLGQGTSGALTVNNIDRGTHEAAVHIVNEDGIRVKSGESISFTVHRPSRLN